MLINRRTFIKTLGALTAATLTRLGLPTPTWANTQQLIVPPTVQHVTEDSATFFLRLAVPSPNARLVVAHDGQMVQNLALPVTDRRHLVHLSELEPATTYQYRLLVGDEPLAAYSADLWENLQFTTQPFADPVRFGALGDTGFGDQTTTTLVEAMAGHDLDFTLHLGDVVYWMHEHDNDHYLNWYLKYFKPFYPLLRTMPIYPTMGNHDFDEPTFLDDQPTYNWVFPSIDDNEQHEGLRDWYTFMVSDVQFIGLNSQLFYLADRERRAAQEMWLDEQLARTDSRYKIVFCHVSPYNSGAVHQWDGQPLVERWVPRFESHNVKLVITGHAHLYERLQRNGVHYIVAGSGSARIYPPGERLAHSRYLYTAPAYPIFELHGDHIRLRAYDLAGQVVDDAKLNIPSP